MKKTSTAKGAKFTKEELRRKFCPQITLIFTDFLFYVLFVEENLRSSAPSAVKFLSFYRGPSVARVAVSAPSWLRVGPCAAVGAVAFPQ